METMARKTSDIDHEGVLHEPRQFDERDRPSNSAWDLDELNSLKAKLKIADTKDPALTKHWCIYKVPPKLRKVNEEAYTPSVVSIGPYHHGDKRLESMQELKVWYLNRFLKRTQDQEKSLEYYFNALKSQEDEIRRSYSETIHMESHEFVSMVLTDACFIIEFLLAYVGAGEHLVQKLWPTAFIEDDLFLLENQLPFFVFTYLFDDAFPSGFDFKGKSSSFVEIAFAFFKRCFVTRIHPNKETRDMFTISVNHGNLKPVLHLCDVLRSCFLPRDPRPGQPHTQMNFPHSVSQLHEAGMELQADKENCLTKLRTFLLPRGPPPRQPHTQMNFSQSVIQLREAGMERQGGKEIFLTGKEIFLTKLRAFFLPRDPPPRQPGTTLNWSHSVSQLHEAGMEFRADKESFVTELKYSKGVLTIPCIEVRDATESMLRNVIAFEMCHYFPTSGYVIEYAVLLDGLINNEKDVEILVGKKIMVNNLDARNKVASMVKKLCYNVTVVSRNEDYISLRREMDKFCENRYHKYKAIFVREYWSTPWRITSVIAATLLLLLTFIQTISSVT